MYNQFTETQQQSEVGGGGAIQQLSQNDLNGSFGGSANSFKMGFNEHLSTESDKPYIAKTSFTRGFEPVTKEDVINYYKNRNSALQNQADFARAQENKSLKNVAQSRVATGLNGDVSRSSQALSVAGVDNSMNIGASSAQNNALTSQKQDCFPKTSAGGSSPTSAAGKFPTANGASGNFSATALPYDFLANNGVNRFNQNNSSYPPKPQNPSEIRPEFYYGNGVFGDMNNQHNDFRMLNENSQAREGENSLGVYGLSSGITNLEDALALLDNPNFRQRFAQIVTNSIHHGNLAGGINVGSLGQKSAPINFADGANSINGMNLGNVDNSSAMFGLPKNATSRAFSGCKDNGVESIGTSCLDLQTPNRTNNTVQAVFAKVEAQDPDYFKTTAARGVLKSYINEKCTHLSSDEISEVLSLAQTLENQAVEAFKAQNAREKSLNASNRAAINKLGTDSAQGKRSKASLGKIFTRSEIGAMSLSEYKKNEAEIFAQYRKGLIN